MKEVVMPSGAKLQIEPAPFVKARDLFQAVLDEGKNLKIDFGMEMSNPSFKKDVFCTALSSKKIEEHVWRCMEKVTYNSLRVTMETFEPLEARGDYFAACFEVAQENVLPFLKSLYVLSNRPLGSIGTNGPA